MRETITSLSWQPALRPAVRQTNGNRFQMVGTISERFQVILQKFEKGCMVQEFEITTREKDGALLTQMVYTNGRRHHHP
jgi:hypothetical protein